jgi:hypothetical protein
MLIGSRRPDGLGDLVGNIAEYDPPAFDAQGAARSRGNPNQA